MKAIIFDSSTLISFAMNGMFEEFRELKKIFDGKFIITEEVKKETIDKPLTIRRFEFEALKIKGLLEDKTLEMPSSLNIKNEDVSKKTNEVMEIANNLFEDRGKNMHVIDLGEASCLAVSRIMKEKGIENVIAVDERTTRMLVEKPENLQQLLEKKLHTQITLKKNNFKFFSGFKIIRSTELSYVAYKKGIIKIKNNVLGALLYALKFKGCSISDDEISEIKKMG